MWLKFLDELRGCGVVIVLLCRVYCNGLPINEAIASAGRRAQILLANLWFPCLAT